jgi:lipoprotein-anchoring transpeptidase ErfK/SrfK
LARRHATARARAWGGIGALALAASVVVGSTAAAAASTPGGAPATGRASAPERVSHRAVHSVAHLPVEAVLPEGPWDVQLVVSPADGGDLALYAAPGDAAPTMVLPAVNELGSPLVLLAVAQQYTWYEVLLPTRPNGSTAWVPAGAVTTSAPTVRVEVSLGAHQLQVVRIADGAVLLTSPTGGGAPDRPTPTGRFFVRDLFPTSGANHPYGPMAFGLSGHSDVLMRFGTGDGRIAIHGTNQPSSIGVDVSNGCVHVPNDIDVALIDLLTLGTPVNIAA